MITCNCGTIIDCYHAMDNLAAKPVARTKASPSLKQAAALTYDTSLAVQRERARIRRLIGPALREAKANVGLIGWDVDAAANAYAALGRIDDATKPEPKRKVKR